eukprot:2120890-Pleurochrysis_carterae.AAC.1
MAHIEKELLYIPGKTHIKKVSATEPGAQAPGRHTAARGRRRLLLHLRRGRAVADRVPGPAALPPRR